MSVTISNGRTWQWFWALLFFIAAVTVVWLYMRPLPDQIQYVDRMVTRIVPIQRIQYEVKTDTVLKLSIIKNTTDEYFLEKRIKDIDSLKAIVRQYAERGDTAEVIAIADTIICTEQESVKLCDTLHLEYLTMADRFRIALMLAPRPVEVRERSILVPHTVEIFPFAKKAEWAGYGAFLGIVGVLVVQVAGR